MRHRTEYNDTYGVYMCVDCGTAFTQDALIAELDAHGCPGPKAEEGPSTKWTTAQDIIDKHSNASWYFTWSRTHADFPTGTIAGDYSIVPRPNPYEDAESKGRRLIKSAGLMNDDE